MGGPARTRAAAAASRRPHSRAGAGGPVAEFRSQLWPPLLCRLPARTKAERNPSLLALLRVRGVTGPVAPHSLQGSALSPSSTPTWAGPTLDHTALEALTGNSPQACLLGSSQAPVECGQASASQPPTHTPSSA